MRSSQLPNVLLRVHTDHLGTPRAVSNGATVLWRWEGDQFGDALPNEDVDGNGVKFTMPLRHAGQYFDSEVGLFYNYFRDYNPKTGRYVQSDPIGLKGGMNTYGYVGGNALGAVDPRGLETTMVCRPVTLFHKLGLFKPVHCAVVVWHWEQRCKDKIKVIENQYSLAGGGTTPINPNMMSQNERDTYNNDTNAFNNPGSGNSNYNISPPLGMSSSDFDSAVKNAGDNYSQGPYRIPPFGNNSNTAADNIIERAGGNSPNIPGAWGQNYGE